MLEWHCMCFSANTLHPISLTHSLKSLWRVASYLWRAELWMAQLYVSWMVVASRRLPAKKHTAAEAAAVYLFVIKAQIGNMKHLIQSHYKCPHRRIKINYRLPRSFIEFQQHGNVSLLRAEKLPLTMVSLFCSVLLHEYYNYRSFLR